MAEEVRYRSEQGPQQERGRSVRIVTLQQTPDGRVLAREQIIGIPSNPTTQGGIFGGRASPVPRGQASPGLGSFEAMFGLGLGRRGPVAPINPLQSLLSSFFGVEPEESIPQARLVFGGPRPTRPTTNQSRRVNPEEEFAMHSQFVRSNRHHLRDVDFLRRFLETIESEMTLDGGQFVVFEGESGNQPNRMNNKEVQQLKVTKYKKISSKSKEGDEQCPICCEELKNGDDVKVLPCKHTFHPGCIDTWLIKNCTCPICKRDVKELMQPEPQPANPVSSPSRRRP